MVENKRVAVWDNIKFFLILLVCVGHFSSAAEDIFDICWSIDLIITSFHMPFFIFVAGCFYKDKGIKERIMSFVAIYVVSKAVFLIEYLIKGWNTDYKLFYGDGLPWFMFALAVFYLLNYLFRNQNKLFVLIMAVVIAIFAGYDNTINTFLTLNRIITFYPFFLAGSLINRKSLERLFAKRALKITGLIIFAAWCVACFVFLDQLKGLRPMFTGGNQYAVMPMPEYGGLYRMFAYIITSVVGLSFLFMIPTKRLGIITKFGERTIQVYFWHYVVIHIFTATQLQLEFFFGSSTGMILWLLMGVLVTFILSLKIFQYPTCWLQPGYIRAGENQKMTKKRNVMSAGIFVGLTAVLLAAMVIVNPKCWKQENGSWYYKNFFGVNETGWVDIKDNRYYFDEEGVMATGEQEIDGRNYLFADGGQLISEN